MARRYAEWNPTRDDLVRFYIRRALWWPLRPALWVWRRIEQMPWLAPLWERLDGPDYTGWRVRHLCEFGSLKANEVGTVTGYTLQRRRRHYTVAFERADLFTNLPAPRYVELIGPGA